MQSIIRAVDKLSTKEELVADGSRDYSLPTIPGKHSDLKTISSDTVLLFFYSYYIYFVWEKMDKSSITKMYHDTDDNLPRMLEAKYLKKKIYFLKLKITTLGIIRKFTN